jgi:hypothetical protein
LCTHSRWRTCHFLPLILASVLSSRARCVSTHIYSHPSPHSTVHHPDSLYYFLRPAKTRRTATTRRKISNRSTLSTILNMFLHDMVHKKTEMVKKKRKIIAFSLPSSREKDVWLCQSVYTGCKWNNQHPYDHSLTFEKLADLDILKSGHFFSSLSEWSCGCWLFHLHPVYWRSAADDSFMCHYVTMENPPFSWLSAKFGLRLCHWKLRTVFPKKGRIRITSDVPWTAANSVKSTLINHIVNINLLSLHIHIPSGSGKK